jgi:hypothetical protein
MSGRSCSAACADFFARDAVPVEEAPQGGDANRYAFLCQPGPDLLERDVGLLVHQAQDQRCMRFNAR